MDRTTTLRKYSQLFVSWATAQKGKPVSCPRLAHRIVETIGLCYRWKDTKFPIVKMVFKEHDHVMGPVSRSICLGYMCCASGLMQYGSGTNDPK